MTATRRLSPYYLAQCESMLSSALNNTPQFGLGIIMRTNNTAMQARAMLYEFRKQFGNPEFLTLQIRFSPDDPDNDLWIFNQNQAEPTEIEQR